MKDYATESDIIETADPLFYPGETVKIADSYYSHGLSSLQVRDCAWDALYKTWTYCLVRVSEGGDIPTAVEFLYGSVPEKDLKLIACAPRHVSNATPGLRENKLSK